MRNIKEAFKDMPNQHKVLVKYREEIYYASEHQVRWLQLQVFKKIIDSEDIIIYDVDSFDGRYEMQWREDGKFCNEFVCNIFSLNAKLSMDLIFQIRQEKKKQDV